MIQKVTKEPADPNVLHIEDLGPIPVLDVPMNPGTVVELEAPNGAGKTTALTAAAAIVNKRSAGLTSRDGTTGGRASFNQVTIKVGRNGANRRTQDGDPDGVVIGIEDRLNVADFVDPPVKDPAAADLRRVRAIVQLTQTSPDMEQYHDLAGGPERFAELVKDVTFDPADPVGTADKIKRAFEAAARVAQTAAENHHASAVAKLKENDGIDLTAPHDAQHLQLALEQAISTESGLKQQRKNAADAAAKRAEAEAELAQYRESMPEGHSIEQRQLALKEATFMEGAAERLVNKLRDELKTAEAELQTATNNRRAAETALAAAQEQQRTIAGWEAAIAAAADVANPTDEQLAAAAEAIQQAREAMSLGVRVRDGLKREAEAKVLEQKAADSRRLHEQLRNAAQGTMDVLSAVVKSISPRITVDGDLRLVVTDHARGKVYFGELSAGERWRLAFDLAIEAFRKRGERGLLVIPQEAWEGLDADNRREIVAAVEQTDLIVITAQASRDPGATGIKVNVYGRGQAVAV